MTASRNSVVWAVGVVCVLSLLVGPAVAQQQLRRCVQDTCRKYASSNQWKFCPHCGTELPEAPAFEPQAESTLIGNVFTLGGGFTIERPSDQWVAVYGDALNEINPAADLFLNLNDEYCFMVMDEFAPGTNWTLEDYAKLVEPGFDEAQVVFKRNVEIAGLPGLRFRFDGKIDGIPMIWDQVILGKGDQYYQINAWSATWQFDEPFEQIIEDAHASFAVPPEVLQGNDAKQDQPAEDAPASEDQPAPSDAPAGDGAPRAPRG